MLIGLFAIIKMDAVEKRTTVAEDSAVEGAPHKKREAQGALCVASRGKAWAIFDDSAILRNACCGTRFA